MTDRKDVQISFCLPVYNVREYLDACIRSIYEQNIADFEIICVDDASTDGSREELERIAENHREILVLHNESNLGIGYARNRAIKNCAGKYIWFVDADDMLVPDTAGLYLDIAEKTGADAVLGKCIVLSDPENALPSFSGSDSFKTVDFSDPDQFYGVATSGRVCFGVWTGLFRRAFLLENDVFFHEEIEALEEYTFYVEFGVKLPRVVSVDHYGYYYRLRASSASHESAKLRKVPEAAKTVLYIMEKLLVSYPRYEYTIRANMARIERSTETCLVRFSDTDYVKKTLRYFKEKGFYPHSSSLAAYMMKPQGRCRMLRTVFYRALRIEPFFWTIHYVLKIFRFFRRRGNRTGIEKG